jgi:hypothetical protein
VLMSKLKNCPRVTVRWKAEEQEGGRYTSCCCSDYHQVLCVKCGEFEGVVFLDPFTDSAIEEAFRGAVRRRRGVFGQNPACDTYFSRRSWLYNDM